MRGISESFFLFLAKLEAFRRTESFIQAMEDMSELTAEITPDVLEAMKLVIRS